MKFDNIFFLILMIVMLCSCQSMDYKGPSQREIMENKIISQTAKQLKEEENLIPVGFGGSDIEGKEFLSISFNYFEPLDIEKAREITIYAAQIFLENLNSNEQLEKFITKLYLMKNIELKIFCFNVDYSDPIPPNISLVKLERNIITYYYDTGNFEKIHEETYEEAIEKLKQARTNNNSKN